MALVTLQLIGPLLVRLADGAALSWLMVILVVLKQPVAVLVAVTEYTPAWATVAWLPLWAATLGLKR